MSEKLNKIIILYLRTREERAAMRQKHAEEEAPLTARMALLEQGAMEELGPLQNAKCEAGTAYKIQTVSAKVGSREAFISYLEATGNWHLADLRAAAAQIEEVVNDGGGVPPGVDIERTLHVRFRKG